MRGCGLSSVSLKRRRFPFRWLALAVLLPALVPATAGATHVPDQSANMSEVFRSPYQATHSDLAFWGSHAFVGYYSGDTGSPANTGSRGGVPRWSGPPGPCTRSPPGARRAGSTQRRDDETSSKSLHFALSRGVEPWQHF